MKAFGVLLLCMVGTTIPVVSAQREMRYSDYIAALNEVVAREKTTREAIAREQGMIENIRLQLAQIEQHLAAVIQEKYAILGVTEREVLEAEAQLYDFKALFQRFVSMSDEEFAGRRSELISHESNFNQLTMKRVCMLYRLAVLVDDAASSLAQVRIRLSSWQRRAVEPVRGETTKYTVGKSGAGRTLWDIAAEVYRDPCQWPRIYRANKRRIDRWFEGYVARSGDGPIKRPQDFVLPGRTLDIP